MTREPATKLTREELDRFPELKYLTTEEVYWIAGLLEGEGCFQWNKPYSVQITLEMTDEDTAIKARNILSPTHNIREHSPRKGSKKTTWKFEISRQIAISWMRVLSPIMSSRRQTKIAKLLEIAKNQKLLPSHIKREKIRRANITFQAAIDKLKADGIL